VTSNQVSNEDDAIFACSQMVDKSRESIDGLSRGFLADAEGLIGKNGWHGKAAKEFRDQCDALVNEHAKKLMDQMAAAVTTLKSGQETFVNTEDTVSGYADKINY
jgi:uncharacterized protein YukE